MARRPCKAGGGNLTEASLQGHRPLVSVVIPAKNEEEVLPGTLQALQTIRAQEFGSLDIVVGVGDSEDGTEQIALELADKVVRVGLGPSRARNQAAAIAEGEILIFLDADAKPLPGAIKRIVEMTALKAEGTYEGYQDVVSGEPPLLQKEA